MTFGVVLSGGGARGAYEVGVLSYAFGDLARDVGKSPNIDLICGTSVGAVNGAFLGSILEDLPGNIDKLANLWTEIRLGEVFDFGVKQVSRAYRVLLGGNAGSSVGLLDAAPLAALIEREIRWRNLSKNIQSGRLRALTISTTQVSTGRPVVWVEAANSVNVPTFLPGNITVRRDMIRNEHVLASAAIPFVFPPVVVGTELYVDGGLRLNTPMAPAIHMGADRLLVIGLATQTGANGSIPALAPGRAPGATFLVGKVLNAFMLDHVNSDIEELERWNMMLECGQRAFGPDYIERLNNELAKTHQSPRRIMNAFAIKPSLDIGRLAGEHLRRHAKRMRGEMGSTLLRMLDIGEGADADLASYLLFDGEFARTLIELGREDAARRRDELAEFLFPEG